MPKEAPTAKNYQTSVIFVRINFRYRRTILKTKVTTKKI